ncbi:hypothetical protein ACX801_17330 [Arthrobacter bambusae]|uniref:hypothetical protein n=1 Tax=Arthrobacter sp. efr-133-R2A-120 TaxID=3040277 RepID=UPI00254EA302|nr:hypothetical protein [Arthrobacter sp. efr-133-R2A-120]
MKKWTRWQDWTGAAWSGWIPGAVALVVTALAIKPERLPEYLKAVPLDNPL